MVPDDHMTHEMSSSTSSWTHTFKLKIFMAIHAAFQFVNVYKVWIGAFVGLGVSMIAFWFYWTRPIAQPLPAQSFARPELPVASIADRDTVDLVDPGIDGTLPDSPVAHDTTIDEAIAVSDETPETMREAGYAALKRGAVEEAIHWFEMYTRQVPDNVEVLYTLGQLYWKKGDKKRAQKIGHSIRRLDPHHAGALVQQILMEEGTPEATIVKLKDHLSQAANPSPIWAEIGRQYALLQDWDAAIFWTKKAMEVTPSDGAYMYNLAVFYEHKKAYREAVHYYRWCGQFKENEPIRSLARERLKHLASEI